MPADQPTSPPPVGPIIGPVIGPVMGMAAFEQRSAAIGEVHARPHPLIEAPRLLVQLSFMTGTAGGRDHAVLAELSQRLGIAAPDRRARHHAMKWGKGTLRWERHTEFSTYLWDGPLPDGDQADDSPFGNGFSPPGPVIAGIRLEIRTWASQGSSKGMLEADRLVAGFDPESLCYAKVEQGMAAIATDFRQNGDGLTRMLVLDGGLSPSRAGTLAQRLIEIETYRTLCMLGLPLAQALSPRLSRIEDRLAHLTGEMRIRESRDSHRLLAELTELAAELEAEAAASLYRFGASRAYDEIVAERLAALGEEPVPGFETWSAFLRRRVAPAMRTCRSVEARQADLSGKLSRAANLLRTWVDVEMERANRDLLASMNERARLQLRLQQTVEGLSVAAVSYYIVGLIGYLAKGAELPALRLKPETLTALAVPFVVALVWLFVRRIRRAHGKHL